jgi:hypothetical protein
MSIDPPNPYQTPDFKDLPPGYGYGYAPPGGLSAAILTQQRVISILMIVQGTLSLLTGIFLGVVAAIFPAMVAADMKRQGGPQFAEMQTMLLVTYGAMAACGIVPGLIQIFAGIQNLWLWELA